MNSQGNDKERGKPLFSEGDVETAWLFDYVGWSHQKNDARESLIQLPPLQRDAVWKIGQVERLWDSLLRGFPIGSFLLAPRDKGEPSRGIESHEQHDSTYSGWYLLDGHQRTRALILGVAGLKGARLWIDMAPQSNSMTDRAFLFRVCTDQHPWGMQQSDPNLKNEEATLSKARGQLREIHPHLKNASSHYDFNLSPDDTWPVSATLPVPFVELMHLVKESVNTHEIITWTDLLPKYKRMEFEKHQDSNYEKQVIEAILNMHKRMVVLLKLDPAIDPRLSRQALELPDAPDAIETLFERVNSGGTRLEGEDMMFSLLKAKWADAYRLVQSIVDHERVGFLLPPTAIVLSAARLARARLASTSRKGDDDAAKPKVKQFRRWIAEEDGDGESTFLGEMKRFIGDSKELIKPRFVRIMLAFIDVTQYRNERDIGLPRSLLQSLDRFAIEVVLRWIDTQLDAGDFQHTLSLSLLPILRFLVHSLLAWTNSEKASRRAFNLISDRTGQFPDEEIYKSLINEEEGSPPVALEMPCPHALNDAVILPERGTVKGLRTYTELFLNKESHEVQGEFVRRFWDKRVILLWFQRAYLEKLFPGYDPLKMRSDSPFDYDHILPSSHLAKQGKSPKFGDTIGSDETERFLANRRLYRDSIGNLRIWPGWANRRDQDAAPDKKLGLIHDGNIVGDDKLSDLGYEKWSDIRDASAIYRDHDQLWKGASGESLDWSSPDRRRSFQNAVERRVGWLYESLHDAFEYRVWLPIGSEKVHE